MKTLTLAEVAAEMEYRRELLIEAENTLAISLGQSLGHPMKPVTAADTHAVNFLTKLKKANWGISNNGQV